VKNVVRSVRKATQKFHDDFFHGDESSPRLFHTLFRFDIYIPAEVLTGTKAEAEATRARRAKICFIMVESSKKVDKVENIRRCR
jgi:hypothetical protein